MNNHQICSLEASCYYSADYNEKYHFPMDYITTGASRTGGFLFYNCLIFENGRGIGLRDSLAPP